MNRPNPLTILLMPLLLIGSATALAQESTSERGEGVEETEAAPVTAFSQQHRVTLPGTPEEIYDAVTGDISGWWDHHFSESPARFYLEAKPGGCFCEIFDASGDGVEHARVTFARRGEIIRFVGPLGLAGDALEMVHTYRFEGVGDSTRLTVSIRGLGAIEEDRPEAVDRAWNHFLHERLAPYVREGRHRAHGGAEGAAAGRAPAAREREMRHPEVRHLNSGTVLPADLPFSEAVEVDGMLYLSGVIGVVPGTLQLAEGGMEAEARQTLESIRAVLEAHGSSMDRVVKCTVFLADIAEWDAFNAVYKEFFDAPYPARSALGADGLALDARVEVECVATVD